MANGKSRSNRAGGVLELAQGNWGVDMETKFGFTAFTPDEFEDWLPTVTVARTILRVQEHHTWKPNYSSFTGSNHFALQRGMKISHVTERGWSDIGQHLSIFPDGMVLTGRPFNKSPAAIYGANTGSVAIENVGDFDEGQDVMTAAQRDSILRVTAALMRRFSMVPRDDLGLVYHHWFDLGTGERTDGSGSTKSCPGTNFFGGNGVAEMEANLLPGVLAVLDGVPVVGSPGGTLPDGVLRFVVVTTDQLNIRSGPGASFPRIGDQGPAELGTILRVFAEQNGWLKISSSQDHWVSGRFTATVRPAKVTVADSNVRSGPGTAFTVLQVYQPGQQVFVHETSGEWRRIGAGQWIHESLIELD